MVRVDLPEPFASIPRYELTFGPSPTHSLSRISAALGGRVSIYAKREDYNSGIGNKIRKLEYLVPEAFGQYWWVSIESYPTGCRSRTQGWYESEIVQEKWVNLNDPGYDKVGNIQLSRLMDADVRLDSSGFGIEHKKTTLQS